ncbi:MAG: hypothetical protein GY774_09015 [Planctomycetes bacterium]|nr:hypothetical protein [Planctomycetota bacterium]
MSITKVVTDGLSFSVSAAAPATHDIAGFAALTWTAQDSCAIVDAGVLGDTWSTHEDNTLCTSGSGTVKGKRNYGAQTFQLKYYKTDAVRVILLAAFDAVSDEISVLITLSNGDKRYFECMVSQHDEVFGGTGSDVEATVTLLRQTTVISDGI